MIQYLILTAALAASAGWCAGHRTARVVHIPVGATPQQDDDAFLAEETARFWQLVNTIHLPDEEQQ